jgi:hypothetical protein
MGFVIRKMQLISQVENEKKLKKFLIKLEKNKPFKPNNNGNI